MRLLRADVAVVQGNAVSSATTTFVLVYPDVIAHDDGVDGGAVAVIATDETYPGSDPDHNGWAFRNSGNDPWVQGPETDGVGTKINWYFWWDDTASVKVSDFETFWVKLVNLAESYVGGECWTQLYTSPEGDGMDNKSWYRPTGRYYLTTADFPFGEETLFSIDQSEPDASRVISINGQEDAIHKDILAPESIAGPYNEETFGDQTVLAIALATNSAAEVGVLEFTVLGAGYTITEVGQQEFITVTE